MGFTGLAKLARESNQNNVDFSMLNDEDRHRIQAGGQYNIEEVPDAIIVFFNRSFSRRTLLSEANELVLQGRFAEAKTKYTIAGRKDLADFLNQYHEQPHFSDLTSSGSFQMRKPDPRYRAIL